jgi:hypothetical protein
MGILVVREAGMSGSAQAHTLEATGLSETLPDGLCNARGIALGQRDDRPILEW